MMKRWSKCFKNSEWKRNYWVRIIRPQDIK